MFLEIFRKIVQSRWTGLSLVLLTYIFLINLPGPTKSIYLWLTNAIIILLSCIYIYNDTYKVLSIKTISGIYFLIFFGIAPILEYKMKINYWGGANISDYYYILVNTVIIISLLLYLFVYRISFSVLISHPSNRDAGKLLTSTRRKFGFIRLLPFVLLSVLLIFWFNDFSFYNLLVRSGDLRSDVVLDSKTVGLLVNNFLRPFVFNVLILCLFISKQYASSNYRWCLVFAPIALLIDFPTGLPRFAVAALYIPLLLVLFPSIFKTLFLASNALVVSFVTVFPLLSSFRTINQGFDAKNIGFDFNYFTAGHFDAYQNFVRTVSLNIITDGHQLLGAILFFIPRSIWHDKPPGSGELLATKANLVLNNISQTLPAEGYINFGILGIFVFIGLAAYFSAILDCRFWRSKMPLLHSIFFLYYIQILGLTIFILRGDLLNAIAYTFGFLISMAVAIYFYKSKSIRLGRIVIW